MNLKPLQTTLTYYCDKTFFYKLHIFGLVMMNCFVVGLTDERRLTLFTAEQYNSFVTLSYSVEDLMSLLVSPSLLAFLESDSRSLCCCKFILFSSSILGLYSKFHFSLNHFLFCVNLAFVLFSLSLSLSQFKIIQNGIFSIQLYNKIDDFNFQ